MFYRRTHYTMRQSTYSTLKVESAMAEYKLLSIITLQPKDVHSEIPPNNNTNEKYIHHQHAINPTMTTPNICQIIHPNKTIKSP